MHLLAIPASQRPPGLGRRTQNCLLLRCAAKAKAGPSSAAIPAETPQQLELRSERLSPDCTLCSCAHARPPLCSSPGSRSTHRSQTTLPCAALARQQNDQLLLLGRRRRFARTPPLASALSTRRQPSGAHEMPLEAAALQSSQPEQETETELNFVQARGRCEMTRGLGARGCGTWPQGHGGVTSGTAPNACRPAPVSTPCSAARSLCSGKGKEFGRGRRRIWCVCVSGCRQREMRLVRGACVWGCVGGSLSSPDPALLPLMVREKNL
jgi:hypothetical protein